jgi:hypothetical protein
VAKKRVFVLPIRAALVAQHYMEGFTDCLKRAVDVSETFYSAIEAIPGIRVSRVPNGSNLARITLSGTDIAEFRRRLAPRDINLGRPNSEGTILLGVNETWNRTTGEQLADAFAQSMA